MTSEILFNPPPENLELAEGEVHVFCALLDQPLPRREQLAATLSEDERARAARFHFERDRNRFVAGHGLLREILGWLLRAEPARLAFSCAAKGKPRLRAPVAGRFLHFNLAHSGAFASYAVSRTQEVGIDLERIRPMREAEEMAAQFFSAREYAQWRCFPPGQKTGTFFNCWTRKEALLKAKGEGIGEGLNQAEVFFTGALSAGTQYSVRSLTPASGYAAAVAAKGHNARFYCWRWQGEEANHNSMADLASIRRTAVERFVRPDS